MLTAKETVNNIAPVPEGVYTAVCYSVVDAGHQYSEKFDKVARKVVLTWEIPELSIDIERDGKKLNLPRAISKRYTVSLADKAILRKDLEAWRGRAFTEKELQGFDLKKLLAGACQLQVIHTRKDAKTYANVGALMALPKGVKAPKPENEPLFFSFEEAGEPLQLPAGLPEWVVALIKASKEWERLTAKSAKAAATAPTTAQPAPAASEQPAVEQDDVPF